MEDPLELRTAEESSLADPGVLAESQSLMDEELELPLKVEHSTIPSPDNGPVNPEKTGEYMIQDNELILKEEQIEEVLTIKHEEEAVIVQQELIIKLEPAFNDDDFVIQTEYAKIEAVKEEYDYPNSPYCLGPDPVVPMCRVVLTRLSEEEIQKWLKKSGKGNIIKTGPTGKKLKPYKCHICNYRCKSLSNLVVHIRSHTGEKPFACDQCDYRAGIRTHLANHKRIHTGERPFECKFCGYRAYQLGNLLEHEKIHSSVRPYKCDYCDYRAVRRRHLTGHLQIHSGKRKRGEKPFKCDFCDYQASSSQNLKTHVRRHTGERPFKCDYCDYQSAQKGSVNAHMKRHTGEKPPYKCDHCGYRCIQRSAMKTHLYTHTGKKPFSCHNCGYSTSYKPTLAKHLQGCHTKSSHTTENPCKLEQSEKECALQAQPYKPAKRLKTPYLITRGLYICSICQYTTSYKPSLAKHMTTCHGESSPAKTTRKIHKIEPSDEESEVVVEPQEPVVRSLRKRTALKQPGRFSDFILPESDGDDPPTEPCATSSEEEHWMEELTTDLM